MPGPALSSSYSPRRSLPPGPERAAAGDGVLEGSAMDCARPQQLCATDGQDPDDDDGRRPAWQTAPGDIVLRETDAMLGGGGSSGKKVVTPGLSFRPQTPPRGSLRRPPALPAGAAGGSMF
eukprot:SAG22_NODE_1150_length_5351_cov_3.848439_6_plen_120_part_01